jgi:PTH1 family peptidyl-tRNA hydrolase
LFLVVGLGNPGPDYAESRHNIGFMVADALAARWRMGALRTKFGGEEGKGEAHGHPIVLFKPMQFMNVSGHPVSQVAGFYRVDARDVVVVHDDIDLEFGRVKVKVGGGHAGHNGLRSIHGTLGPAYVRVRCGVGHPGHKERVIGHVLGAFSKAEQKELPFLIGTAADAVEAVIRDGAAKAMNDFNEAPRSQP